MGQPQSRKRKRQKNKRLHKIKKTKNYTKHDDQIFEDLQPENKQKLLNQPVDEDLPGLGQFYCIECAIYFTDKKSMEVHQSNKSHKRKVKLLKEKPYDLKEADFLNKQLNFIMQKVYKEDEDVIIRELEQQDFKRNYFNLLEQLVHSPELSEKEFIEIYNENKNRAIILVIFHKKQQILIGSLKILFERKFILKGCLCAYYEDMVIDKNFRSKGYGKMLTDVAIEICKEKKCFRLTGICGEETLGFYKHCGFQIDGIAIQIKKFN